MLICFLLGKTGTRTIKTLRYYVALWVLYLFSCLRLVWSLGILTSYLLKPAHDLQKDIEATKILFKVFKELCSHSQGYQLNIINVGQFWCTWDTVDIPSGWNILKGTCRHSKLEIILMYYQPEHFYQTFMLEMAVFLIYSLYKQFSWHTYWYIY